jgi:hypothetical protein
MPSITPSRQAADKAKQTLGRQIQRLVDTDGNQKFQNELFDRIGATWDRRTGYYIDKVPTSDLERAKTFPDFLVKVQGEVLVKRDRVRDAASVLDAGGFKLAATLSSPTTPARTRPSTGQLSKHVARFTKTGAAPFVTAEEVVDELLRMDIPASLDYVLPLGYVAKGEGGFEPTTVDPQDGPGSAPGDGAKVAVIDTGIAEAGRPDGWLANIERTRTNVDDLYLAPPDQLNYAAGHGTFVAGIIQQFAPSARIKMYGAIHSNGIGTDVDVAEAILLAAQDGAQIINLSLGTRCRHPGERPLATQAAVELVLKQGVVVVAAAGNSPTEEPYYPAAFDGVVAVSSVQADGTPSEWASKGKHIAMSVVAEGITSTYVLGQESPAVDKDDPDTFEVDPSWAIGTGTSYAAPQVVGRIAAEMAGTRGLTAERAYQKVKNSSKKKAAGYGAILVIHEGTRRP